MPEEQTHTGDLRKQLRVGEDGKTGGHGVLKVEEIRDSDVKKPGRDG